MPKPGEHFVDVRGRVPAGRVFAGVHGLPRADLAAFFKIGKPYALAEFYVVVELAIGYVEIVFEVLDITGIWREFARTHFRVQVTNASAGSALMKSPLRWHDFCRSLGVVLRRKRTETSATWPELAHKTASELPYPRDLHTPQNPFVGFADEPALVNCVTFGQIPVIGHVFHTTARIRQVWATADLQVLQKLEYHRNTAAIGDHYHQYLSARTSGYLGFVDVPSQLPNPASIRIYAELSDGSMNLVHVLRSRLHDAGEEKFSYASSDPRDFDHALSAWRNSLRQIDIPLLEDADFQPGIDRLRVHYARRSSRVITEKIPPVRIARPWTGEVPLPRRMLVVTHNLNLEGAPLFLLDHTRYLTSMSVHVTVLSPSDGPLRAQFESSGIRVIIADIAGVFTAPSEEATRSAIQTLSHTYDFAAFDLVIANTFTTFWAVHAAKSAGKPVLLYVHESTTPDNFYLSRVPPWIVSLAEEAFGAADAVSFTTASTRSYHLDYAPSLNHWLTSGWIDVDRIDRWNAKNSREAQRLRLQVSSDELLVTNVGTVCERKGQHIFIRAVDLLWHRYPDLAARARFVMLGGGTTPFDDSIAEQLRQINRPNVAVHPASSDYFPYYAAADVFVCSTFEESSPRVILEAMAFRTPILTSNVHGIPEQVRSNREALLVEAGDTIALCEGMRELLLSPELRNRQAASARDRVVNEFSSTKVLPCHLGLIALVAAGISKQT